MNVTGSYELKQTLMHTFVYVTLCITQEFVYELQFECMNYYMYDKQMNANE